MVDIRLALCRSLRLLAAALQVRLKSMHSKQASQIVFSNKSPFAVRALWLDFEGHEVRSAPQSVFAEGYAPPLATRTCLGR